MFRQVSYFVKWILIVFKWIKIVFKFLIYYFVNVNFQIKLFVDGIIIKMVFKNYNKFLEENVEYYRKVKVKGNKFLSE